MSSGRKSRAFGLINWARAVEGVQLTPSARHVLLLLATYADAKTRLCSPGVTRLARETGLARSTVQTALAQLEASRLIVRQRRHRDSDGGHTSNIYELRPIGFAEGGARSPGRGSPITGQGGARPPGTKNSHDEQPIEQPSTPLADASGAENLSTKFEQLLKVWPRQLDNQARERARKTFERHLKHGVEAETMIAGARRYAVSDEWSDEDRICDLRGWLFAERWTDEHEHADPSPSRAALVENTGAGWMFAPAQPAWMGQALDLP